MSKIIVYSAPNCFKCTQLKNKLVQKSVEFEEINVRENVEVVEKLRLAKLHGFPQVEVDGVLQKDYLEWVLSI